MPTHTQSILDCDPLAVMALKAERDALLALVRGFLEAHDTGVLSPVKDARALLASLND